MTDRNPYGWDCMMNEDGLNFDELFDWLKHGIDKGWVTEPFCYTHEGDPYMSEEEQQEWEDGGDPCAPVIKLLQ